VNATQRSRLAAVAMAAVLLLGACDAFSIRAVERPDAGPLARSGPDDCAAIERDHPEAMTLGTTDGGCVPPSRAVVFRCDEGVPPIAVLDAANRPRRFLGGRYEVPVPALPVGAVHVGTTAGMTLWRLPGEPEWLFVEHDGGLARWLALPDRAIDPEPNAFVIGDSISLGAQPAITESLEGWDVGFDAVVGRGSSSGVSLAAQQGALIPEVVVVELGTNDVDPDAFRGYAAAMAESLAPIPLVVWQTTHGPMEELPAINRAILAVARRSPSTAIADWDRVATDEVLSADGIHPTPEGTGAVADLLAPILKGWFAATQGAGAAACVPGPEDG
jgi:lysophospholipase L1-like esterase